MGTVAGALPGASRASEHRFFRIASLALAVAVFVGFAPGFYLHAWFPATPVAPEPFFALHGAAFTAWVVLFAVQASLAGAGRLELHRRLGYAGAGLAALMVVLGTLGGLIAARRPQGFIGNPLPPIAFLGVPLIEIWLFGALVALAIAQRGEPRTHKRLMLIATASITTAAFARWPVIGAFGPPGFFLASDAFLVALAVFDWRSLGRLHPATVYAGGALLLSEPAQLLIGRTEAWGRFARWAIALVG